MGIFLKYNTQANHRWFIIRSSLIHDNCFSYFTILGLQLDNLSRLCGLSITIYKSSKIEEKWNQASHLPNIQQLSIIYYLYNLHSIFSSICLFTIFIAYLSIECVCIHYLASYISSSNLSKAYYSIVWCIVYIPCTFSVVYSPWQ